MKKKRIIIPMILATAIGVTGCVTEDVNKNQVSAEIASTDIDMNIHDTYKSNKPIVIELMTEELGEEDIFEWKVTTPMFAGHDKLTALVAKDITNTSTEFEFIKTLTEGEDESNISFTFLVETGILTNTAGVITCGLNMYNYTGGAHGMYWTNYYNYDLVENKEIKLGDLFKEDVDYHELLCNIIMDLVKGDEYKVDNLKEYYIKKKEPLLYFNDNGSLKIYFSVYAIGSYAEGEQVFEIERDKIESGLSDYGKLILDMSLYTTEESK